MTVRSGAASVIASVAIVTIGSAVATSYAANLVPSRAVACENATAANEVTPPPPFPAIPGAPPPQSLPPLCPAGQVPAATPATGIAVPPDGGSETSGAPAAPSGYEGERCSVEVANGCYWHAGGRYYAPENEKTKAINQFLGAEYETTVATPKVSSFKGAHSLDQFLFGSGGPGNLKYTLEAGWTVAPDMGWKTGEPTKPHYFVFINWNEYAKTESEYVYEEPHFVPEVGATVSPGTVLPEATITFGGKYEGEKWWLSVNDVWIGYVPESIWSGNFRGMNVLQTFGEVFDNATPTSQMGTGRLAGKESGADTISQSVVELSGGEYEIKGPEATFANEPKLYAVTTPLDGFFAFGGPGVLDPPPSVVTEAAGEQTTSGAKLNATVDPNGGATRYYFEYGRTTAYGNDQPAAPGESIGSGTEYVQVHTTLSGLKAGTEYHYRVVASNDEGITYGQDQTVITTLAPPTFSSQFGKEGTGKGQFKSPEDDAFDGSEHLWVTDRKNNRIEEFTSSR